MRLPPLAGHVSVPFYAAAAPALILSQHVMVALVFRSHGWRIEPDMAFWLLPLRRLGTMPDLSPLDSAFAIVFALAIGWALVLLSFRRAARSGAGYGLAGISLVPGFQILAVAILAVMPLAAPDAEPEPEEAAEARPMLRGVLAGAAIIVFAVLVSAVTFGAYGWGLFVLTPFIVGATTGYIANRPVARSFRETVWLVVWAGMLGTFALLMFALEGFVCILLVAPLAAVMAVLGGALGRAAAGLMQDSGRPTLAVALLPAVFALEAAMPPAVAIATDQSVDIAAPPASVWAALTSRDSIAPGPGLVGRAGLAYPLRGRLLGEGVGAVRLGDFSTGTARERVTAWKPGRELAFAVLSQPPAMEEMSPWRRVHAPHVEGYFETGETRFELEPLAGGGTRLRVRASHILRLEPILYWEPLARWAVRLNTARVLEDIRRKAEALR